MYILKKYFARQIYSYSFHISKIDNLKGIHDLCFHCLIQTISKIFDQSFFQSTEGVYIMALSMPTSGAMRLSTGELARSTVARGELREVSEASVEEVGLRKPHPRLATLTTSVRIRLRSRRETFAVRVLTKTLILLKLREDCCAGMVPHGGACLRCRRHGWLHSGDEGSKGPGARRAGREHRTRGQRRHGRGARRGATRPGRDRYFGAEGAAVLDTWLPPTCKEGSVRGRDKGCRV
jgi:hypothetical protein